LGIAGSKADWPQFVLSFTRLQDMMG